MIVEARMNIKASRAAIWAAITDMENAASIVSGIKNIEMLQKPANGWIGLRWRETRILFNEPATVEKWITEAVENEYFQTRAESDGLIFLTTVSIVEGHAGFVLSSIHDSQPQSLFAKIMSIPMSLLFKGVARKAILQDLKDIKSAVELHD